MATTARRTRLLDFLKSIYQAWIGERPAQKAAALAYFSLFSIAPLIFVAFTVASLVVEQIAQYSRFYERLSIALGPEAAQTIQAAVSSLGEDVFGGSTIVTLISVVALFYAASGMFFQLQFALNEIFKAPKPESDQTKSYILQRLFSFLMVIGMGLLVILAAILNVIITWLGSLFSDLNGVTQAVNALDSFTFFGLITLSFAFVYKILPDAKLTWLDVLPGAALAALLELIAGIALGIYFRFGGVGSAFEAAGTFALILISINIFAQVFLFGAIFTREYARWFGSGKRDFRRIPDQIAP